MSNKITNTGYALERLKKREEVSLQYGIPIEQILDMGSGNNMFIPPRLIQKILIKQIESIDPREGYPIDYYSFLEELSRFLGVPNSTIYPGLTHIQLIQRLISTLTQIDDTIILLNPEKEIYHQIATEQKLNVCSIDLQENLELNLEVILNEIKEKDAKAILFSSPHYPTANQFNEKNVLTLAKETKIPIIIDESYVEFGKYTLLNKVQFYNNLTVVRSFSKAWGLGAISCAYLVSNIETIEKLTTKFFVEEIPPTHILATNHILQAPYRFVELINGFVTERKRVIDHLKMLNKIKVHRSDANFLFISYKDNVEELYEYLCSKGIIIQIFNKHQAFKNQEKFFLVTLGDSEINDRFILALIEFLESSS